MKKIFLFALAALMIFSTAGCADTNYNYDLSKYITVGQYSGIEVSKAEIDKNLEATIASLLEENNSEIEVTDRAVQNGDIANIDYTGKIDGETFDGGSAVGYDLEIGSDSFIEGFEDSIIGKNIGDTYDAELTFPEDYGNSDLAGKAVVFTITVNSIKEKVAPTFDDAFVAEKTEYKTVDEYKAETFTTLRKNYIWGKVLENSTIISYPKANIKKYYDNIIKNYTSYASAYGYSLETFLTTTMGTTMEGFLSYAAETAKNQIKQEMIMFSISRANNIEITDSDYKAQVESYAKKAGYETVSEYVSAYSKDGIKKSMLMDKVLDYVVGLAADIA